MRISVAIIAHNEEKHIAQCIKSVLSQTRKADEIILIVHNSTDNTFNIAQSYPIKVIKFEGESGPLYAREEAVRNTSGDIIICTDGDTSIENNWIEVMSDTLNNNQNILVGSYIKFTGTIFHKLGNIYNKYLCKTKNGSAPAWLWGASFAFWGKDKDLVLDIFEKVKENDKELGVKSNTPAEDYWLALYLSEKGNIEVTNKTYVTASMKEVGICEEIKRNIENHKRGRAIKKFFNINKKPL